MTDKLLLLSCCAPCSCAVIASLALKKKNFTVLFYNPNIRPMSEYDRRCAENKRVCEQYGIPFVELEYDPENWDVVTHRLMDEPERGRRCSICFEMRLRKAYEYAQSHGFDAVTSVLGVSRHKDFDQVNRAADAVFTGAIPYLAIDWRSDGLDHMRRALTQELSLYKQNYCGCKPRARISFNATTGTKPEPFPKTVSE